MCKTEIACTEHVKAILGLTVPPTADPIWCIGQLLEQVGLKIKAVRKEGSRGEQVRIYQLDTELFQFAVAVLEHRAQQRQEREQRRQEERELRADYAARLDAIYGSKSVVTPSLKNSLENLGAGMPTAEPFVNQENLEAWLEPESVQEILNWWAEVETRTFALDTVPIAIFKRLNLVT
ncbi:hypothetical protein NDI45_20495 [Leptolyngbya sp. GB1-A1]|uniref:hypothetical protein n=1 Tax=Leptolyngbya sp. GB1-A1 TaxID=2933908 RepID=UPI0032975F84